MTSGEGNTTDRPCEVGLIRKRVHVFFESVPKIFVKDNFVDKVSVRWTKSVDVFLLVYYLSHENSLNSVKKCE